MNAFLRKGITAFLYTSDIIILIYGHCVTINRIEEEKFCLKMVKKKGTFYINS